MHTSSSSIIVIQTKGLQISVRQEMVTSSSVPSPSWGACDPKNRVSVAPIDVVACDQQGATGTLFTLDAGHFARGLVLGTLTGLNMAVPYSFSLGPR